jgi:hypothetical protein
MQADARLDQHAIAIGAAVTNGIFISRSNSRSPGR